MISTRKFVVCCTHNYHVVYHQKQPCWLLKFSCDEYPYCWSWVDRQLIVGIDGSLRLACYTGDPLFNRFERGYTEQPFRGKWTSPSDIVIILGITLFSCATNTHKQTNGSFDVHLFLCLSTTSNECTNARVHEYTKTNLPTDHWTCCKLHQMRSSVKRNSDQCEGV